jgi:hypothetical protein
VIKTVLRWKITICEDGIEQVERTKYRNLQGCTYPPDATANSLAKYDNDKRSIFWGISSGVPKNCFWKGVLQIQLRTEGGSPLVRGSTQFANK